MGLSQQSLEGNQLTSALEAYKELKDSVSDQDDMLDRVRLMLKVVGQNLMDNQIETHDIVAYGEGVIDQIVGS